MTTQRSTWRFYGRKKEINELRSRLEFDIPSEKRLFSSLVVTGRRGVGKTQLLNEMKKYAPLDVPVLICELTNPGDYTNPVGEITSRLFREAHLAGMEDLKNKLPVRQEWDTDRIWFMVVLTTLLKCGAVVVLDEFHLARLSRPLGLETDIKQVIDQAKGNEGDWRRLATGKLVLMGSHQQKMDDMLKRDQPLHLRPDTYFRLSPWSLSTVMAMAADQGVLVSPGRFLTLWTAYDGLPRNWERYSTDSRYSPLHDIKNDKEWRVAFLAVEGTMLETVSEERFDDRTSVELKEEQARLMMWLGKNKPLGAKTNDLQDQIPDTSLLAETLDLLVGRLELLSRYGSFLAPKQDRWKITDNNTLFQVHVFSELVPATSRNDKTPPASGEQNPTTAKLVSRLAILEGLALERLVGYWLATKKEITWYQIAVWRTGIEGDMDVMAYCGNSSPPRFCWGVSSAMPGNTNTEQPGISKTNS